VVTCKGTKEVTINHVRSVLACCLVAHAEDSPHRWQGQADGAAIAIEWHDRSRVLRDSALNGVRTGIAKPGATDEEIALALLGYLADRPEVARLLLADLPAVVG
jgi:hypothetical protein